MSIYTEIDSNKRRSVVLMVIATLLVLAVAYGIMYVYGYGPEILVFALGFAVISNLISFFKGDKIALALNGAKEIQKDDNPYLWRMVENLTITAGMPMPRVYIINDSAMNAFATGRNPEKASVAFTTGIIDALENEELEGVVAHELSHIQNYDIRVMTLVATLIGVLMIIIDMAWRISFFGGSRRDNKGGSGIMVIIGIVLIILAPLIGQLIQMAVSRKREYLADASGSLLTRYPEGLASALEKISVRNQPMKKANHATAHFFIANPFGAEAKKNINKFFSTHPPIEDRVAKLRNMGNVK